MITLAPGEPTDEELVARHRAGDDTAFPAIIARYREHIFSIALAQIRNHSDAEEIAQDTFIRAHRGLVNFRGDSSLATWLYRIAVNLARNRYWYFFRRMRHATLSLENPLTPDGDATFADLLESEAMSPTDEAQLTELREALVDGLTALPPLQHEILWMRVVLHMDYEAIAAALKIKLGSVKSRIARARELLAADLAAKQPDFGNIRKLKGVA